MRLVRDEEIQQFVLLDLLVAVGTNRDKVCCVSGFYILLIAGLHIPELILFLDTYKVVFR